MSGEGHKEHGGAEEHGMGEKPLTPGQIEHMIAQHDAQTEASEPHRGTPPPGEKADATAAVEHEEQEGPPAPSCSRL